MMVAETEMLWRSSKRSGVAKDCERAWMIMRRGTAERMTRVRAQERTKARTRQVMVVVRCWTRRPEAKDEACRTSSVSLYRAFSS